MIMKTPEKIVKDFNSKISKLCKTKSENSISQINNLHKSLINLEIKCDKSVAHRYLIGFLEEKGAKSYEEYIENLS